MGAYVRVAGVVEVGLVVAKCLLPEDLGQYLPLGGGHIQQLGIVLGFFAGLEEVKDLARAWHATRRERIKIKRDAEELEAFRRARENERDASARERLEREAAAAARDMRRRAGKDSRDERRSAGDSLE